MPDKKHPSPDSELDAVHSRIDESPSSAEVQWIDDQLTAFNTAKVGFHDFEPVQLVYRQTGSVVGGLKGVTGWGWLHVQLLYVSESARGNGIGSHLLDRAEKIAVERGCTGSCLSSFCFQAPSFYEQQGYETFGNVPNYPEDKTLFFLSKRLDQADNE